MGKPIPVELNPAHQIEIDGALVAEALGLEVARFRQLLEDRKITVLCERGLDEDAGQYRASFYHEGRRARLVVDEAGRILGDIERQPASGGQSR